LCHGHMGVTFLLLEAGAVVAAKDTQGMVPLHLAAFRGNENVLRRLLEVRRGGRSHQMSGLSEFCCGGVFC